MTTTAVLEAQQGREGSKTMKEDEAQNSSNVSDESPRPAHDRCIALADWEAKLRDRLKLSPMTAQEIMIFVGYSSRTANKAHWGSDCMGRVRQKFPLKTSSVKRSDGKKGRMTFYSLDEQRPTEEVEMSTDKQAWIEAMGIPAEFEYTYEWEEHPDGFEQPCACGSCRSYVENDEYAEAENSK